MFDAIFWSNKCCTCSVKGRLFPFAYTLSLFVLLSTLFSLYEIKPSSTSPFFTNVPLSTIIPLSYETTGPLLSSVIDDIFTVSPSCVTFCIETFGSVTENWDKIVLTVFSDESPLTSSFFISDTTFSFFKTPSSNGSLYSFVSSIPSISPPRISEKSMCWSLYTFSTLVSEYISEFSLKPPAPTSSANGIVPTLISLFTGISVPESVISASSSNLKSL